jgi:taurine dioxygenase
MVGLSFAEFEPFGVEVDLELSEPLAEAQQRQLVELLWRYHLLRFRDQRCTLEQQIEVMSLFGPVNRPWGDGNARDYVSKDPELGANLGDGRLAFHSDLAHSPLPYIALSLFGLDLEPNTTSTRFIDSCRVFRQLPAEFADCLAGLEALHVHPSRDQVHDGGAGGTTSSGRSVDVRLPHHQHLLVLPHPVTGEKILYVNEMLTDRLVGLDDDTGDALLAELFARTYRPENIYEHWWNIGDLVIWDNLAVQHGRGDQRHVATRTLRRVACGERDMYEQNQQVRYVNGTTVLSLQET